MSAGGSAVTLSALATTGVALVGAAALAALGRSRPSAAALGAPVVVVAALAGGVAMGTRSMVLAEDDYRTLLFVLAAGAPVAVMIGMLIARRVGSMQRRTAQLEAAVERDARIEGSRREMIQWLSHDLRTPLAGVRALAESLDANAIDDPAWAHRQLIGEVDRIDAMVDDIAALSQLQNPHQHRREVVGIDDIISDAAAAVSLQATTRGVSIVPPRTSGAEVSVDVAQVTRALINVLRNAIAHTPEGAAVRIETSARMGGGVQVAVSDTCGGIPAEHLPYVFEAGWRGDLSRSEGGLGLGLAIVRAVARDHGGDATVVNQPDATGCTLTFGVAAPSGNAGSYRPVTST